MRAAVCRQFYPFRCTKRFASIHAFGVFRVKPMRKFMFGLGMLFIGNGGLQEWRIADNVIFQASSTDRRNGGPWDNPLKFQAVWPPSVSTVIGNIVDCKGMVVCSDMFDAAFAFGEPLKLPTRRVDQLIIGLLGIVLGNLAVVDAVGHEERHLYPVHMAVKVHVLRLLEEIAHVLCAKHPEDMPPIMRDRVFTFALHPFVLNFVPIVVGSPGST